MPTLPVVQCLRDKMDIKKFLETVDKFDFAGEKRGQRPGQQWRGTDKGLPGTKLVGEEFSDVVVVYDNTGKYLDKLTIDAAAEKYNLNPNTVTQQLQHQDFTKLGNITIGKPMAAESVMKELDNYVKENSVERKLKKDFDDFSSEDWADWDDKIKRLKQRAKQGELVTVWDPEKRVYKNVPKSEIKEYQNRQDPDAQVTSPPSPDASQTALDQIQDKIFARDVEGETVEEQDATSNPYQGADAKKFGQMSKADQQWYTQGNKKPDINDPYIAMRAPNQGQAVAKPIPAPAAQATPKPVAQTPGATSSAVNNTNVTGTNLPPVSTQIAQTKVRPTVVDQPRKVKADPNAFKTVPQQQLRIDTPSAAKPIDVPKQPTAPKTSQRTTWRSLAKLNPQIKNPDRIYPGQEITLPNGTKAIVDKGDTLSGIAQRYRQGGYAEGTPVQDKTTGTAGRSTGPGGPVVDPNAKATVTTTKAPLSVRNNNPGNLRFAGQPGAVKDANGYARFETPEAGRAAMRRQLNLDMQRRGMNLTQALNKYAPPSDNNPTDKYIDFVAKRVGIDPTKPIPKNKMAAIQRAMVEFEGGKRAVDAFYPKRTLVAKAGTTAESLITDYQKFVTEYGNQQNPDTQATSQDSAESDAEAELKRQRMDRRVSQATLAGLSAVLPPGTNTAVAATALNKIVDQKPLSPQENQVIGTLMPLLARAAEEPSTSASLKTALGRAGMLTKLGKQ